MAIVHIDTVDGKDGTDFFDDVGAAGLNAVSVLELIRMVRLHSVQIKDFRVLLERLEVDALHEQVRLGTGL